MLIMPRLFSDSTAIRMIFTEYYLISNIIPFLPEIHCLIIVARLNQKRDQYFKDNIKNGKISIIASDLEDKIVLRVRDNGCGMTKDQIDSLWKNTQKSKNSFNQIGLQNIKDRIIMIYGNECGINIISEPGIGTEIILTIRKLL